MEIHGNSIPLSPGLMWPFPRLRLWTNAKAENPFANIPMDRQENTTAESPKPTERQRVNTGQSGKNRELYFSAFWREYSPLLSPAAYLFYMAVRWSAHNIRCPQTPGFVQESMSGSWSRLRGHLSRVARVPPAPHNPAGPPGRQGDPSHL